MLFILKSQFFKVGMSFVITTRKMRNLIPQTLSVSPPSGVWMEATVLGVTQNFIVLMLGFLTANAVRYLPPIAVIYIFSLVRYLHLGTLSVVFRADGCLRPLAFFFWGISRFGKRPNWGVYSRMSKIQSAYCIVGGLFLPNGFTQFYILIPSTLNTSLGRGVRGASSV